MVRALLAGRKTQTRRLAKVKPGVTVQRLIDEGERDVGGIRATREMIAEPRFAAGDRLYVREHWKTPVAYDDLAPSDLGGEEAIMFLADGAFANLGRMGRTTRFGKHRQGMHMPRWASRMTLMVEAVKVERLNEISEADAVAEGVRPIQFSEGPNFFTVSMDGGSHNAPTAVETFQMLWECLHGIGSWAENPFVVAVTFSVVRGNIDQLPAEAA